MTIDLYTWGTPNGRKVSIMLEEVGLPYTVHTVDIGKDEQFAPDFLKISPNNKIPAIVDPDGPGGEPTHCSKAARSLPIWVTRRVARSGPPIRASARSHSSG